jgi:hypothetical protein
LHTTTTTTTTTTTRTNAAAEHIVVAQRIGVLLARLGRRHALAQHTLDVVGR